MPSRPLVGSNDCILVTGAAGFIGRHVIANLLGRGFQHIRCLTRQATGGERIASACGSTSVPPQIELVAGNLLSTTDCAKAVSAVRVIYHLAAGSGEKSYPEAFLNSVVTTRNLLEAARVEKHFERLVNISSFAVYSNCHKTTGKWLDETCPLETRPELRGEAYTYAKVRQDQLVLDYGQNYGVPYVIVRPGVVYGPGKERITGRIGVSTFGFFMHLGGRNEVPITHVTNCAEAIVLAGVTPGITGEVFNVVDDDLPSSSRFLSQYKRGVKQFRSVFLPHLASYLLCCAWEWYSNWSEGQLPPAFNRRMWHAYWKPSRYTNCKIKQRLGWQQIVPTERALSTHFEHCRRKECNA